MGNSETRVRHAEPLHWKCLKCTKKNMDLDFAKVLLPSLLTELRKITRRVRGINSEFNCNSLYAIFHFKFTHTLSKYVGIQFNV